MKNILIISSSPRKKGNSQILCEQFKKGAEAKGHQVKIVRIMEQNIGFCRACDGCMRNGGTCVLKDDMAEILKMFQKADVLVLATPVYFYGISAQMKTFIDRTYPIWQHLGKKEVYYIISAGLGEDIIERSLGDLNGFVEHLEEYKIAGKIYAANVMDAGLVKNQSVFQKAYDMGYLDFFERTKMTTEQIRNIYVENGMKTRISIDTMTVWHKEDTWRIKSLPKKGHVQLYHNNYAVRANGVREFTQGFHIQSLMCADTDIRYVLNIIKKYEYKPEEYALHNGKLNKAEKKKAKQCQVEKIQKLTLSLEALLGEKTAEPTLWQKVKSYISGLFSKKTFFELNDFLMVSEQGYPKNQAICVYIWKDKNEQLFWQTGIYNQKLKQFSVCYGTVRYAINGDKVIAWKKMNADAVALEITDRRN